VILTSVIICTLYTSYIKLLNLINYAILITFRIPPEVHDSCVFRQVRFSATGRSLVKRSPTERGVSVGDLET